MQPEPVQRRLLRPKLWLTSSALAPQTQDKLTRFSLRQKVIAHGAKSDTTQLRHIQAFHGLLGAKTTKNHVAPSPVIDPTRRGNQWFHSPEVGHGMVYALSPFARAIGRARKPTVISICSSGRISGYARLVKSSIAT